MCEWRSALDLDYKCRVPAEPGSAFCILHEPGKRDVTRFVQALNDQTEEIGEEAKRNLKYDFRGYEFPQGIAVQTPGSPQVYGESILACDKRPTLCFAESVVHGQLNLAGARINDLSLVNATVKGFAMLFRTTIVHVADFRGARFESGAAFNGASFDGFLHLAGVCFHGSCAFDGSTARTLNLGKNRPTVFPLASNRCGVSISLSSAGSFWPFVRRHYEGIERNDEADAAFYFERLARLSPMHLGDSGRGWRCIRFLERWAKRACAGLFVWLPDALLLRWPSAYGASLARLAGTWTLLVVGFASAYFVLTRAYPNVLFNMSSEGLAWPFSFGRALYFSVTTFTTLGFGDFQPAPGLGSALCAAEAILGGVIMALTVLVAGRKFMRR